MKCDKCGNEMTMILQEKSSMKIERIYRCNNTISCGNVNRSVMMTDKEEYLNKEW